MYLHQPKFLEAWQILSENFEQQYQNLLNQILSFNLPIAICTIYYPNYSERLDRRLAIAELSTFNNVIIRQAFQFGIPLIYWRLLVINQKIMPIQLNLLLLVEKKLPTQL